MANTQITQYQSNGTLLILHPETIAEIVNYTDNKVIGATNVQTALDILAQAKKDTESSISSINTNVSNAQSRADSAYSLAEDAKIFASTPSSLNTSANFPEYAKMTLQVALMPLNSLSQELTKDLRTIE